MKKFGVHCVQWLIQIPLNKVKLSLGNITKNIRKINVIWKDVRTWIFNRMRLKNFEFYFKVPIWHFRYLLNTCTYLREVIFFKPMQLKEVLNGLIRKLLFKLLKVSTKMIFNYWHDRWIKFRWTSKQTQSCGELWTTISALPFSTSIELL